MAPTTMMQLFTASVERCPNRAAVIHEDTSLTYKQLEERINQCARVLSLDLGVKPGDRVAYLLPNSLSILEVFYAIQQLGAIAVPINCRHIAREIAYLLESAQAQTFIYSQRYEDKAKEALALHDGDIVSLMASSDEASGTLYGLMASKSCDRCEDLSLAHAVSRIQFTGGSTGLPKGAVRTHAADVAEVRGVMASNGLDEAIDEAVVLVQCPLEHHGGHSWFTSALAAGATLVVCGDFHEEDVLSAIDRYKVTHMILLPPVTYLRLVAWPDIHQFDLSSVRLVQSAAGANNRKVIEAVFEYFPHALFNYGWGQSEGGLGTTQAITREIFASNPRHLLSIGKPMLGVEVKLVNKQGEEVTDPYRHGEALIRSAATMSGYYNQLDLSAAVMEEDGWLHTGDLMLRDENGYFYLCSRTKDVIKSGGENVFVGEVESVINLHEDVLDCMVFGTSDPVMEEAVAAVVSLRPGAELTGKELQDHCKQHLSSYKKPRYILFVGDLGKDSAGKVAKHRVKEYFEAHKEEATI